jgi:hypothetical protein
MSGIVLEPLLARSAFIAMCYRTRADLNPQLNAWTVGFRLSISWSIAADVFAGFLLYLVWNLYLDGW